MEDTNTKRGVYVNQNKIDGYKLLKLYDIINIGNTHFVFYGDYIAYNLETFRDNDLEIHIKERSVRGFFKRQILLKDINLRIEPGNMVLILGGSGAGKTTFINAVTGYEKANAAIRQGDVDVYDDYEKMKYRIGMVPQQDLLRGDDTVIMTLSNAAEMRMPTTSDLNERKERVNELLRLFGLENVRNELVDKLSGGQRKRLSIATEFVANPSIFILDEPDSGLDGVMARDLMKQLRNIADQNKIVMVITHTPDRVIDMFDKVIVLAKDSNQTGQLAFYGTVDEAKKFFNRKTMEDIILTVNSEGEGGEGQADIYIRKFQRLREEVPFTPPDTMDNGVGVRTSDGTALEPESIPEDPIYAENDEKISSEDILKGDLLSDEKVEVDLN
ncbi:MAG: ABC transporter ATP-binding protein [Oribacterium sp.]|nr:ABC transporter ATP-binding protein [Oribacterium sp.]